MSWVGAAMPLSKPRISTDWRPMVRRAPVATPDRLCVFLVVARMMATLLPQNTGVFTNDQCLPSDRITFAHQLGIAECRTVLTGRMHFKGPDQHHGFHERLVGDIGDTNGVVEPQGPGNDFLKAMVLDTRSWQRRPGDKPGYGLRSNGY